MSTYGNDGYPPPSGGLCCRGHPGLVDKPGRWVFLPGMPRQKIYTNPVYSPVPGGLGSKGRLVVVEISRSRKPVRPSRARGTHSTKGSSRRGARYRMLGKKVSQPLSNSIAEGKGLPWGKIWM